MVMERQEAREAVLYVVEEQGKPMAVKFSNTRIRSLPLARALRVRWRV
jgi:hypothetical protein